MKLYRYLIVLIIALPVVSLMACSSGPDEKPESTSFSSPARLLDQGVQHYSINDYPKAIDLFEKALLQYRSIDNQAGIANSCLNLAKTYMAINNNQVAAEYLLRADAVIEQASLHQLDKHLSLLKSSLAINNALYDQAIQELDQVLTSQNIQIQLAALKNRTTVAFLQNDTDKLQWLEKYRTLQNSNPDNTASHTARILRFEAETTDDGDKKAELLSQSLSISQSLATRTAIAATLTQWADFDLEDKRLQEAEDRYLRALFIRHQLGDVKNSLAILEQLKLLYSKSDTEKEKLVQSWIDRLHNHDLSAWNRLYSDFDLYPKP